jgi:hypothetical protein
MVAFLAHAKVAAWSERNANMRLQAHTALATEPRTLVYRRDASFVPHVIGAHEDITPILSAIEMADARAEEFAKFGFFPCTASIHYTEYVSRSIECHRHSLCARCAFVIMANARVEDIPHFVFFPCTAFKPCHVEVSSPKKRHNLALCSWRAFVKMTSAVVENGPTHGILTLTGSTCENRIPGRESSLDLPLFASLTLVENNFSVG